MSMWQGVFACLLLLCFFSVAGNGSAAIEFPLIRDGVPVARVVAAGEEPSLQAAVEDLRAYVARISGAELNVVAGTQDLPGPTLHLGETDLFEQTEFVRTAIRLDGFCVVQRGEDLLIAGNLPQGTANGIVTVLQDQFGVRWYHAGSLWEVVPPRRSLTIRYRANAGPEAYVENPSYLGRELWGAAPDKAFGRRMRLTQLGVTLPYVGTGHSLDAVVPASRYFADHPDYFALVDGKRSTDHPCFTHPDMPELFMQFIRKGKGSLGVNDNVTVCRCDRCLAVDGRSEPYMGMPNVSESYFQLIRRVAEQTAREFPQMRLGVFAYQITNAPPKTVDHIGRNVDVVLCQDTSQHFDRTYRRTDRRMAAEWVRKSGGVRMYDYYGINYWMPRYFPRVLAGQMRYLARQGVLGYGTHTPTMIDSSMPMFYLYYQMLWNAELDANAVVGRMIRDLYGPAAEPVREFYALWEACWMRKRAPKWFYGMDDLMGEMRLYKEEDIRRGRTLLERAAQRADDPLIRQRVQFLEERFAFTHAAAEVYYTAQRALAFDSRRSSEEAVARSTAVADQWEKFVDALTRVNRLSDTPASGWLDWTFRVRAWGLKQLARDAALAPAVRWAVGAEGRLEPDLVRRTETALAEHVIAQRRRIEAALTEQISTLPRSPRADALRVADVPFVAQTADTMAWAAVPDIRATTWVYHLPPPFDQRGRYDEPIPYRFLVPPLADDHAVRWQAAWDEQRLVMRVVVTDDEHMEPPAADALNQGDYLLVALAPQRAVFDYEAHSWLWIWGRYAGPEIEVGFGLRGGETLVGVSHVPKGLDKDQVATRIRAHAFRQGTETVYEVALEWRLLPGFVPQAERSLGISLVVGEADRSGRRFAEYGGGTQHGKRPTEFAAIRLVR